MISLKCKECHIRPIQYEARIRFEFEEENAHSILRGGFCENCIATFVMQPNANFEFIYEVENS